MFVKNVHLSFHRVIRQAGFFFSSFDARLKNDLWIAAAFVLFLDLCIIVNFKIKHEKLEGIDETNTIKYKSHKFELMSFSKHFSLYKWFRARVDVYIVNANETHIQ